MRRLFVPLLVFLATQIPALDFWDDSEPEPLAASLVEAMTVQELASQVLMLAFPDPVPDPSILAWVENRSLGGVKYFGWNAGTPAQVAEASTTLQARSQKTRFRIPLLVATDQEGGWVRHIKGTTTTTPGNLSLGASGLPFDAWKTGALIGGELRQMGVNMNFAPSVDLYTNPDTTVIGPRSFSQDPLQAGILGSAFVRGLKTQGVIATAKHFPGHGNTAEDSHGRLPVIHDSLAVLEKRELVPYRMLIAEGLGAIMSGHISFPEVAGDKFPASLSPQMIQGLLREEMGYKGVVLTDDLYMEGARPSGWTIAQAAVQAIEAGNDLLLISKPERSQFEAWDLIVSRAQRDSAFKTTLQDAVRRVLELKLRSLKGPEAVPIVSPARNLKIPEPGSEEFVLQTTARGATLLAAGSIPWSTQGPGPLVVSPYDGALRSIAARFGGGTLLEYDYDFFGASAESKSAIVARVAAAPRAVFVLATPGGMAYLKALEPYRDKVAVISVLSPVYLRAVPWVKDAIAVFGTNSAAFDVAASVLAGDFKPRGALPFRFGDFPWDK